MEKIVLVTGDRHNPAAHHIKIHGTARVGRGYACDVILSDPHIEPEQMVFHFDERAQNGEGVRTVEILPGINPVFRNGAVIAPGVYPFVSGDEWTFGKTCLTAFDEQQAVEPTEKIFLQDFHGGMLFQFGLFLLGATTLIGWVGLQGWLSRYEPLEWGKDFAEVLSNSGQVWFVLLWSAIMGIIGRFKSGRGQFNLHLITAVLFVVATSCFDTLTAYITYGFNLPASWHLMKYAGSVVLLATLLILCFSYALNIRGMKYMAIGIALCWTALDYLGDMSRQNPLEPRYSSSVKPPFAVMVKPVSVENFMQQANTAFAETKAME
jgi:hypothetical protein